MTDANCIPEWATKLYSLDLSDEEKGEAAAILVGMPNAAVLFLGNATSSASAVRKLLQQGRSASAAGLGVEITTGSAAATTVLPPGPSSGAPAPRRLVDSVAELQYKNNKDIVELHSSNSSRVSYVDVAGMVVNRIRLWAETAMEQAVDKRRGRAPSPLLVSGLVKGVDRTHHLHHHPHSQLPFPCANQAFGNQCLCSTVMACSQKQQNGMVVLQQPQECVPIIDAYLPAGTANHRSGARPPCL
ncbi:hypothetical protein Vretimale_17660 [Volvox reticuliferus]|uniref:Uncharacterized protein n=1 Tax=Volvox reticuliferus TaxID=1737510 RepID=A0A8J4D2D9_9CHLO|nr:hypothetical protein Vretifemale_18089 [Volvox reticuliferus]GIM14717.1 hypothetical protein Vretimale_17660 [Volvox reticuliferus]